MFYTIKEIRSLDRVYFNKGRYYNNIYYYDECTDICLLIMVRKRDGKETQTIFDYCNFQRLSKFIWYPHHDKNKPDHMIYVKSGVEGLRIHRVISKPSRSEVVDHLDHNPLNNLSNNIRICSIKENNRNLSISKRNSSGYKNIRFDERKQHYIVEISTDLGRVTKTFSIKNWGNRALSKAICWRDKNNR